MKQLRQIHVVQFSFWEWQTFDIARGFTGIVGANGAGKTSLLDAIQIAIVGAHGHHMHFNAQSVHKDERSLRDYALGMMRSGGEDSGIVTRVRDDALTYLTLVFEGDRPEDAVTAGVCISSTIQKKSHDVLGSFVLPGVQLSLEDHLTDHGALGKSPMTWETFDQLIRRRAQIAGRKPTITTKPETYIQELLHSIKHPGRDIDMRRFLKAFAHSLNLKHVESVSEFLRGYMVEASPIDRQGTLRHIKTLRRLIAQIDETREQIVALGDIGKSLTKITDLHQRRAVARAVQTQLQMESATAQKTSLGQAHAQLQADIEANREALSTQVEAVASLQQTLDDLRQEFTQDPAAQNPEQVRLIREGRQRELAEIRRTLDALDLAVRTALRSLSTAFKDRDTSGRFLELRRVEEAWEQRAARGEPATVSDYEKVFELFQAVAPAIEGLSKADVLDEAAARSRLEVARKRLKASESGRRVVNNDVATAMLVLEQQGITSDTVASLVRVTDAKWQCAVETFLGGARHALVVQPGRERDAVRLVRQHQIPEVTIVQPAQLKDDIGRRPQAQTVATLLDSDNSVALAFIRSRVWSLRMVETEEDLERHSHSLTADCMLSAGGGTRRMRARSPQDWVLGVQATAADIEEIRAEIRKLEIDLKTVEAAAQQSRAAEGQCKQILSSGQPHVFALTHTKWQNTQAAVDSARQEDATLPDHLKALEERIENTRNSLQAARQEERRIDHALTTQVVRLEQMSKDLEVAASQLKRFEEQHAQQVQDQDFDVHAASELREKLAQRDDVVVVLTELKNQIDNAERRIPASTAEALTQFTTFINDHAYEVDEERSDWRKAQIWVQHRTKLLTDSTLVDYQREAHEARQAAEQAFRSDVKYKLREAFQRLEQEVRETNKILDRCPTFTNGERYRFNATVAPAHKALYDIIVNNPIEAQLTGDATMDSTSNDELIKLMEACEAGNDKGDNPLEDFRLFYIFDLEIRVNDKIVDHLSKRMGKGSGGEHRVPFYVCAAAALSSAYRVKHGSPHEGAALMLMDEAFYAVDLQNSYALSEFIKGLGLQVVTAYPDDSQSKMLPMLDLYHEIHRQGTTMSLTTVRVKAATHKLMRSDMPDFNPGLVDAREAQLSLI